MRLSTLDRTIGEAERYIKTAKSAKKRIILENDPRKESFKLSMLDDFWNPTKETAACKRASLDLTMALADLRQGR